MEMQDSQARTEKLRRMVNVARREADHAVACREAWHPTAHDPGLHSRMGHSYATNTFLTIRVVLWREMLGALMRIWDKRDDSINLGWIIAEIQKEDVRKKLFEGNRRTSISGTLRSGDVDETEQECAYRMIAAEQIKTAMLQTVKETAEKTVSLFNEYNSGDSAPDLRFFQRIRHEQLAHRQNTELTPTPLNWHDERAEKFFTATMNIVSALLSIVCACHYDLADTAEIFSHQAQLFWASARGERTEGHPNFRSPPTR